MFLGSNPITDRAKGYYPLSVGTSIALEALFGLETEDGKLIARSDQSIGSDRRSLRVNANTLYRNYTNAFEGETYLDVSPKQLLSHLLEELQMFLEVVRSEAPNLEVTFYHCGYRSLPTLFEHAKLRRPNTAKQVERFNLQNGIMHQLLTASPVSFERYTDFMDRPSDNAVVILTHQTPDLWSLARNTEALLLESFTGALKKPSQWNTKYYKGSELTHLPFTKELNAIMGDSETFHPLSIGVRRTLVSLSEEKHWTILTTREKIRFDLDRLPKGPDRDVLMSFYKLKA